jgi:hypothetical protein
MHLAFNMSYLPQTGEYIGRVNRVFGRYVEE